MATTKEHDERVAKITFASIYPHYLSRIEKNGRTEKELQKVLTWLTGFKVRDIKRLIKEEATIKEFFAQATLNPKAKSIKGTICGYRIEEIKTPLTRKARYMDKLVDELAKGRAMEKILRSE